MEIDDDAKEIVREIGTAINESVENSTKVAEAIERLREAGYEMELTLRLEIGLRPHAGDDESSLTTPPRSHRRRSAGAAKNEDPDRLLSCLAFNPASFVRLYR
jgi:hypothetical protein